MKTPPEWGQRLRKESKTASNEYMQYFYKKLTYAIDFSGK
jgi:hypothetical protein